MLNLARDLWHPSMFCHVFSNTTSKSNNLILGTGGRTHNIECFNCHKIWHYVVHCSETSRKGIGILHVRLLFTQSADSECIIDRNWLLLDICSTHNICNNSNMVCQHQVIWEESRTKIVTNRGNLEYKEVTELKHLPLKAYYYPESKPTLHCVPYCRYTNNMTLLHLELP